VLEEKHEGCGAEEGSILTEKLGLAEGRRFVGWWLSGRKLCNWR
jgi:hypothetical protein